MLLTLSIANSKLQIGVFNRDALLFTATLAAARDRTADEYAVLINSILTLHDIQPGDLDSAIMASVVKPLNETICQAVEQLIETKPILIGPGIKTGLNIKTDIPSQVGADLVANSVAACSLQRGPLVIIDFGCATTLTCINDHGDLCGVLIAPGVETSLEALSAKAAELPDIALDKPRSLFGKNTQESMTSGFVYGCADMIDGLLDRIAGEWGQNTLSVIVTGQLTDKIIPFCRSNHTIRHEPNLALLGLNLIYQLNAKPKRKTAPSTNSR